MKLSLSDLKKQTSRQNVVSKEITFIGTDSVAYSSDVFVKVLSYDDVIEVSKAVEWDVDSQNIDQSKLKSIDFSRLQATRIQRTICENEKGDLLFKTAQEVLDLLPSLGSALYKVADEVNSFSGKSKKVNSEKMNSGVNSSLQESQEVSKKPSKCHGAKSVSGKNTEQDAEALTLDEE